MVSPCVRQSEWFLASDAVMATPNSMNRSDESSIATVGRLWVRFSFGQFPMALRRTTVLLILMGSPFAAATTASAAGNGGYGAGAAPPPSAAAGGFINIVTTRTLGASGGTVRGSANGATATVTVPTGALPRGGQLVITTGVPKSIDVGKTWKVVADFSVVVLSRSNGQKLPGPFSPEITVSIHDKVISSSDTVFVVTRPGVVSIDATAHLNPGVATLTFAKDPNYAVAQRD